MPQRTPRHPHRAATWDHRPRPVQRARLRAPPRRARCPHRAEPHVRRRLHPQQRQAPRARSTRGGPLRRRGDLRGLSGGVPSNAQATQAQTEAAGLPELSQTEAPKRADPAKTADNEKTASETETEKTRSRGFLQKISDYIDRAISRSRHIENPVISWEIIRAWRDLRML